MTNLHQRVHSKKLSDSVRLNVIAFLSVIAGLFVGLSFQNFSSSKLKFVLEFSSITELAIQEKRSFEIISPTDLGITKKTTHSANNRSDDPYKIYVESNPHGAESLPPEIVVAETDFYPRRLWGNPKDDLQIQQKYLVAFTVGFEQSGNINKAMNKFSEDFTILLFHYDGRVSEWKQFEWAKRAIHVSVKKQTKWWYTKRFLHPDVVAAYDYIFIWDENLGLEHFDAEKYLSIVKKHGLEISQPGLEQNREVMWEMTKRLIGIEVHKKTSEKIGWCSNAHLPPCAAFVELMAPVFSRSAWRCFWHMIQNDLVHGLGLEFALWRCVEPAHEKIGVVDSQWIVHQLLPSPNSEIHKRGRFEHLEFQDRFVRADKAYIAGVK